MRYLNVALYGTTHDITEGIRLDEETVLKTVGVSNRFGVRVPGLPLKKFEE